MSKLGTPTSNFALVSIQRCRKALAKRVDAGEHFPITLRGKITGVWGGDDGIDQEFQIEVETVSVREPRKAVRARLALAKAGGE